MTTLSEYAKRLNINRPIITPDDIKSHKEIVPAIATTLALEGWKPREARDKVMSLVAKRCGHAYVAAIYDDLERGLFSEAELIEDTDEDWDYMLDGINAELNETHEEHHHRRYLNDFLEGDAQFVQEGRIEFVSWLGTGYAIGKPWKAQTWHLVVKQHLVARRLLSVPQDTNRYLAAHGRKSRTLRN